MGTLDRLARLHLIPDQHNVRRAGGHAGEVGGGDLPRLVHEESEPFGERFRSIRSVPGCSRGSFLGASPMWSSQRRPDRWAIFWKKTSESPAVVTWP